uniref:Frizzled n=1 Tax=Lygus hesperus TaxID=30085 RepID=A0A0A9X482_LYGHE
MRATCVPYNGTVCKGNVPGDIYIPFDKDMNYMEKKASKLQYSFALATYDTGCIANQQALVCGTHFPLCYKQTVGTKVFLLPSLMNQSLCESDVCETMYAINSMVRKELQYECNVERYHELVYSNGTVFFNGYLMFPIDYTTFLTFESKA